MRYLFHMGRAVILYETEGGASPVEKFIRRLDRAAKCKVLAAMKHIEEDDVIAPHLFSKMVSTDDLWEIRVRQSGEIYRLLCFFDGRTVVVVASGFKKKTQKTPSQEIRTAESRKRDYFRRN
jgi:phage-related protein